MPKPSFGCSACRARRIKCDERPGSCLNCERRDLICPGYPDPFDVRLRLRISQGRAVRRHDTTQSTLDHQHGIDDLEVSSNRTTSTPIGTTPSSIGIQMQSNLDEVTVGMLYGNQCVDKTTLCSVDQIKRQGNGCFFAAAKTLCMIQIFKRRSLPNGASMIHDSYSEAISLLNVALATPEYSLLDSTLLATMLLTAVEIKAAPSLSSDYWEQHAKGAAALLQLRGANQVTTSIGSALYFQITGQIMMICMITRQRVPPELDTLRAAVQTHVQDDRHPVWAFQGALFHCVDFRAGVDSGEFKDTSTMLGDAVAIYSELVAVLENVNIDWQSTSQSSVRFPSLLDYELQYQSVIAAQLWQNWRCALVVLCDCVATICSVSAMPPIQDLEVQQFCNNVLTILERAALDTIASLPLAVTLIDSKATGSHHSDICNRGPSYHEPVFHEEKVASQILPLLHGCTEPWAVFHGVQSDHLSPPIRGCLFDILDSAGARLGVHQWKTLADRLRPIIDGLKSSHSQDQGATYVTHAP